MSEVETLTSNVITQPSPLAARIRGCTACDSLASSAAATVRPFKKPCAQFNIYTRWLPDSVRVAFIAESPPGKSEGYFYDPAPTPGYAQLLRRGLFGLLELLGHDTATRLTAFKDRGYILLDTVKCRCRKRGSHPATTITATCATTWLGKELEEIGAPRRLCILGRTALEGLSQVTGFGPLGRYTVSENTGETASIGTHEVLIWPFPSPRNAYIFRSHISRFKQFCNVPSAAGES